MNWDFESFMDKELWEICEEAEKIERQKQEEKEAEKIISQLQMEESSEVDVIQTKEEETEEISEVEQETIEEIKEEILEVDESEKETKQEEEQKQSPTIETEYIDYGMIIKKIEEYLNSEDYKQELISALRKLLEENPKYKEFNEFAKIYYPKLLARKNVPSEVHQRKEEYWLYDKEGEDRIFSFYKETEVQQLQGVYLVVYKWYEKVPSYQYLHWAYVVSRKGVDRRGNEQFYVRAIGENFGVRNMPYTVSGLVYFVFFNKDNYYFLTTELPRELYTYLYCGTSEKSCIWMPKMVLKVIWPIFQKMAEKIKREILEPVMEGKEDILEITEIKEEKQKVVELKQEEQKQLQTEEIKRIENLFNKQVERYLEIVFCKWREYTQNAYLLPFAKKGSFVIYYPSSIWKGGDYFIRADFSIYPKHTYLPKQIYIKDPKDINQIPEGIYPIIRFYDSTIDPKIVFAISPNTEVVFEINNQTKNVLKDPYQRKWNKPLTTFALDFAIVWNNTITLRNLLDFDLDFEKAITKTSINYNYLSVYWSSETDDGGWMSYLPEVLFLHLVDGNVKPPKEEPFIAELILNSQKSWDEWNKWVKSLIYKYSNIIIDNEKLKVIELSSLRKMTGVWYVKSIEMKEDKEYNEYRKEFIKYFMHEIVIVNIRNENEIFKIKHKSINAMASIGKPIDRLFIVVWPDETIGFVELLIKEKV